MTTTSTAARHTYTYVGAGNQSVCCAYYPSKALYVLNRLHRSPLPSRKAGRGSAAIRHAAERAAVISGRPEGELG